MKLNRFLLSTLILCGGYAYATPNFAREYGVECVTCHTMIPSLNDTGKSFLRNGLRFSSGDKPSLKKIISPDKGESRPIPFAVMLSGNYDTEREDYQTKVKLYTGGTITENLSFLGITKENFNTDKGNDNQELFDEASSRIYGQLNFGEDKHVIRAGIISPLTQFGNIQKASADSGLKGHNSSSSNNQNMGDNSSNYSQHQKYGQNGNGGNGSNGNGDSGNGGQSNHSHSGGSNGGNGGNNNYKTPLQNGAVENIKGVEYSYLFNSRVMALFSYGEIVNKGNQGGSSHGQQSTDDEDNYQFTTGLQYKTDSGYSFGVIYNQYEKMGQDNFSLLLPIEKSFDKLQVVSTLVYKDEMDREDSYYGMENALIYSLSGTDYIRGVIDVGTQDERDSYGVSLTYSKAYKYLLFHITGAKKDDGESDEDLFLGSVTLLF